MGDHQIWNPRRPRNVKAGCSRCRPSLKNGTGCYHTIRHTARRQNPNALICRDEMFLWVEHCQPCCSRRMCVLRSIFLWCLTTNGSGRMKSPDMETVNPSSSVLSFCDWQWLSGDSSRRCFNSLKRWEVGNDGGVAGEASSRKQPQVCVFPPQAELLRRSTPAL